MISIVITIYNRENTIEAAIESCLIQDFSHYEIILVDDGSTDNSAHKVEKYLCNNVKYFYQENQGAAAAKNRGVAESQFEFVTFLDSDDMFSSPHTLGLIYEALRDNTDFVSFKQVVLRKKSGDVIRIDKQVSNNVDMKKHMLYSPLNYAGHHPYTFRKKFFLQAGGFDTRSKWGDALIFWRRFFKQDIKYKIIHDIGYIYNQVDSNSLSRN
ncbi:glycosyltransferase family A protein, partial [Escherichia coli]